MVAMQRGGEANKVALAMNPGLPEELDATSRVPATSSTASGWQGPSLPPKRREALERDLAADVRASPGMPVAMQRSASATARAAESD
jgi:hypothetical protein